MSDQRPDITISGYLLEGVASVVSAAALAALFGVGSQLVLDALNGTQGLQDIARMLVGGLIGMIVGAPLGPWGVARFSGRPYSRLKGWAGAILGAAISVAIIAMLSSSGIAAFSGWIALALIVVGSVTLGNVRRKSV